jgi:hypothetical protein
MQSFSITERTNLMQLFFVKITKKITKHNLYQVVIFVFGLNMAQNQCKKISMNLSMQPNATKRIKELFYKCED